MAAPMVQTKHPGIYTRGSRFVVVYRDTSGRQRKESARTLTEARKLKASRATDVDRGEFQASSRLTFGDYGAEWVERYQGNGRRGFRESTRDDYRRLLRDAAIPFLGRKRLTAITPKDVADYIGWLCDAEAQGHHAQELAVERWRASVEAARASGRELPKQPKARDRARTLSDSTVRNCLNPVRSCLATAKREGLIRSNPAADAALPARETVEDEDGERVRPFTGEQLDVFLRVVHPRHRLMFHVLAATGLRISELLALQWRHLRLDGSAPCVRVRRAIVRGRVQPPKSRHGRRDVPLSPALVDELRAARKASDWSGDEDLVFPSREGTAQLMENLRRRVLRPATEEAGASWAGFHTFRHTVASRLFAEGRNVKQVQRWLGHHSPSFTLDTYVHLLEGDLGEPLDLGLASPPEALPRLEGEAVGAGALRGFAPPSVATTTT